MAAQTRTFQAEVSKLLHIVANSLYSDREVFLRELISNASDACDKLRYLALTTPALAAGDADYKIRLVANKEAKTLTIADNGIGMSESEMHENLGTIARSGTEKFLENASGDAKSDMGLIGRFGVGFYSAFMVSDKVEVLSRKAGEETASLWTSDGLGEYTVSAAEKASRGTIITMHLKDDAAEFLEESRLRHIVKTYSDHISIPIVMPVTTGTGDEAKTEDQTLNQASALWRRNRSEIEEAQYSEFYKHVSHAFDDPWLTVHWRAEGVIEYTSLLFVPSQRPLDLFHPDRKSRVKLYVQRVFITDDCEGLVPEYLRFLRGVVDCEDLPLNVSRELLQRNPVLSKVSTALTKRILSELEKKAEKEPEAYAGFWNNFGAVMKEGLYAGDDNKGTLLKLARFRSTHGDGLASLADYVGRMKEGQEAIYYITGESADAIGNSPHLEGFRAKGVEVLLLSDPIDDFWIGAQFEGFEGKPFKSVTRGGADLDSIGGGDDAAEKTDDDKQQEPKTDLSALVASLKLALGDAVKDVRESKRLTDSAVVLVAEEGDMDMNLERLLRQHKQLDSATPRVLEVNPKHPLIKGLAKMAGASGAELDDAAHLLLDQARILDGEQVPDPRAFARRMTWVMEKGLA